MCPISEIYCSVSNVDEGQTFQTLLLKNVGSDKLYVKFKYQNEKLYSLNQWFDCKTPLDGLDYFENTEVKIETSYTDPTKYGCELLINYDGTVDDVIIHDYSNSTWNSIANNYGTFDNSYLLVVSLMIFLL